MMKQIIIKESKENDLNPSRIYSLIIENTGGLWGMVYKFKTAEPYKKYEEVQEEIEWEKQNHQLHMDAGLMGLYEFIEVFMPLELVIPSKIVEHLKKFACNDNLLSLEVNFDDRLYDQRFVELKLAELKIQ
jgi:hypothetical protein